jgi:hemerythrin-like metal-binding protein
MTAMATVGAVPAATGGCRPPYLQWIKSFESGSAEIDALHRELLDECNKLLLALEDGAPWPCIVADAGKLVEGCIQHFRHEEELLAWTRFPRRAEHIAEHRRLERELRGLLSSMSMVDGSLEEHREYPRSFAPMLIEFMIRHDLDFRSHLLRHQGL